MSRPGRPAPWVPDARARAAGRAVFVVFALNGFVYASWISRLPAVKDQLGLSATGMGLVLLVGAAGALVALPLTGALVDRIGSANTTRLAAATCAAGLASGAVAVGVGSVPRVAIASLAAAMGVGAWDVSMNIQGAVVEHAFRRTMLPRFHAGFSLGGVVGAAGGAVAAGAGVSVTAHVIVTSVLAALLTLVLVARYLPDEARPSPGGDALRPEQESAFAAWLEPRTILIGLVVLAAALAEGSANDWLALAVVDGFGAGEAVGAVGLGIFVLAMTLTRVVGTRLIDRFGRVLVLRASALLALAGLVAFALVPSLPVALVAAGLWGLGSALGFPVGMSAAADDPARAAARVSVVSSIGYIAFLAGPPLLGLLADRWGFRLALLVIAVPMVLGMVLAFAAAPLRPGARGAEAPVRGDVAGAGTRG